MMFNSMSVVSNYACLPNNNYCFPNEVKISCSMVNWIIYPACFF